MIHGREKSDPSIVAAKPTTKAGLPVAEPVEPREGAKGNMRQQRTRRAQDRESVSQVLARVRKAARSRKTERFTSLLHHLDPAMLRTAFFALKRDAAAGVDGLTWRAYEADLDRRIEDLHRQVQGGAYRAQPSRRAVHPEAGRATAPARDHGPGRQDRPKGHRRPLHPEKTRLIQFGRHAAAMRARRGLGKPETFAFLGFTFVCGKSLRGKFLLLRLTRRDRMVTKLKAVKEELRRRRHQPIPVQGAWLAQVVGGFFNYHAVPTNTRALSAFRDRMVELWRRSLRRRSQRDFTTWERMRKLASDWLPRPRILHPWPSERFAVKHPRWEPSARIGPARICAGGAQQ